MLMSVISVNARTCCVQHVLKNDTQFEDIHVDVLWGGLARKQLDNPHAVRSQFISHFCEFWPLKRIL